MIYPTTHPNINQIGSQTAEKKHLLHYRSAPWGQIWAPPEGSPKKSWGIREYSNLGICECFNFSKCLRMLQLQSWGIPGNAQSILTIHPSNNQIGPQRAEHLTGQDDRQTSMQLLGALEGPKPIMKAIFGFSGSSLIGKCQNMEIDFFKGA